MIFCFIHKKYLFCLKLEEKNLRYLLTSESISNIFCITENTEYRLSISGWLLDHEHIEGQNARNASITSFPWLNI